MLKKRATSATQRRPQYTTQKKWNWSRKGCSNQWAGGLWTHMTMTSGRLTAWSPLEHWRWKTMLKLNLRTWSRRSKESWLSFMIWSHHFWMAAKPSLSRRSRFKLSETPHRTSLSWQKKGRKFLNSSETVKIEQQCVKNFGKFKVQKWATL